MSMDQAPERPADLGAYLRALRRGRWLSLRAVAGQSGVSNSYLSQIENGHVAQPSPHMLQKLATVYGVPVETLLARAGYIRPVEAAPALAADWQALCARAVANAPKFRAALAALQELQQEGTMSMDQAPENNLPPGTGLRLGGDWIRERDALRKQVEECESHNTELQGVIAAVRTWAQEAQRAATNRLAQGSPDPRYWQSQLDAAKAVWDLVKPVV